MRIESISFHTYQIPLTTGQTRSGVLIHLIDEEGNSGWGETAPLPKWSWETLDQAISQLTDLKRDMLSIEWTKETCQLALEQFSAYPSVHFGLESALLGLLAPLPAYAVPTSALLMGSPKEIMEQAHLRISEGFTSAKLKVSGLSFDEAGELIHQLKDRFLLRVDVNRAWGTVESLRFFSQFSKDTFDYVEEPFINPKDLHLFQHPLAVDESFPQDLSLEQLEGLTMLKALIYKPTIQGGMFRCRPLLEWAERRGIAIVLSSSFESEVGLAQVASIAQRLSLASPVGIGTFHYLGGEGSANPLRFSPYCASSQEEFFPGTKVL